MALSFRSVANGFTRGLRRVVFTTSLVGMHSRHVSVNFEKGTLNCSRKKHPRHLLFSVCTDKTCITTGTLTKLKVALAKPVFTLNTALRAVFGHGVCHILRILLHKAVKSHS